MDKILIHKDQSRIDVIIATAEAHISTINKARLLAVDLTGKKILSISGETEVFDWLKLKDYPNASSSMAANLLGVTKEYEVFKAAAKDCKSLNRYEINDGQVVVSNAYKKLVEEDHSTYIKGEKIPMWKALERVCSEINNASQLLPTPIAHQMISIDYQGKASVNIQKMIQLGSRI